MKAKARYAAKWIFHYIVSPAVPKLPFSLLRQMANVLGSLNYMVNAEIRHHICQNLKDVFPERPEAEIRKICRLNFINHAIHSLEILYLPSVDEKFVEKYINLHEFEHAKNALDRGKGIVFALGHIGFYYLSGVATEIKGIPMNDISQDIAKLKIGPLDRKILERRLGNYQSRISGKVFHRGGSLLGVVKAIKRNEAISLFIDALTTERDPVVNFLGHKIRAPQGPIRIAMQTGAAIIFSSAIRERSGAMTLTFHPRLELEETGDRDRDLQRNAQRLLDLLEHVIYERPDQWHLWRTFHERCIKRDETAKRDEAESYSGRPGRGHDGVDNSVG